LCLTALFLNHFFSQNDAIKAQFIFIWKFQHCFKDKNPNICKPMKITRSLLPLLKESYAKSEKIIIIYGARQTGKTTLSNDFLAQIESENKPSAFKVLKVNADELRYVDVLSSRDLNKMKLLTSGYDLLFIDEAQRIPEIGINLKILHDSLPNLRLIVTGSSSLDLANKVKEPLTGRTSTFNLYPISLMELSTIYNAFEMQEKLEEWMIFGLYPDIINQPSAAMKEKYLRELSGAYLYKDIIAISQIRNSQKIHDLLKLLAFQIGSEVSVNELAKQLGMSQETVNSYIDLLEQSFIIFRLSGFSRNLRKEVSKRNKIYFWDCGVRNAIINNFSLLSMRNDQGSLWENFIIAERLKASGYRQRYVSSYFWRTYTGAELDYVEEKSGQLFAYEIKYKKQNAKAPKAWIENYSSNFQCITRDNFWDFVL